MPNGVQQIGASALRGNQLTEVVLPSNLTTIGDAAFRDNQLQALVLPDSVNSVGVDAFSNNKLATLDLPDSLTSISASAFSVNQLTAVTLPNNLTTIAASAFQSNLITHLTIPNTVSLLGTSAFRNNRLTSVIFEGPKPTTLGTTIFSENTTLPDASIVVPLDQVNTYVASTTSFGVTVPKFANADPNLEDGLRYQWNATLSGWEVYEYADKTDKSIVIPDTRNGGEPVVSVAANTFKNGGITSLTLSNNLKNIGVSAFESNALTTVTIPSTVTTLGNQAFRANTLTNIIFNGNNPTTLGINIFSSNNSIPDGAIWVSAGQLDSYRASNRFGKYGVTALKFGVNPNDASVEGEFAYSWNSTFNGWNVIDYINRTDKTVSIPSVRLDGKPVVSISGNTFSGMGLTSLSLPSTMKKIGASSFANNLLTSLVIPSSVESVDAGAFTNNQLTSLTIQNGVVHLNSGAFENNLLSTVTIPSSVTGIDPNLFAQNRLTSVNLPNTIEWIGRNAFRNNLLTSITLPNGLIGISEEAFESNRLTSVVLSNSLKSIGAYAFQNNQISSITIPENIVSMSESSFANNNELASVTFNGPVPLYVTAPIFNGCAQIESGTIKIRVPNDYCFSYRAKAGMFGLTADNFQSY